MNVKRRPLIAGNWKMNGLRADGIELARDLARQMNDAATVAFDMLVCPPLTLTHEVAGILADSPIMLGAQDCHTDENGAHTGDVSASMLADAGCDFVIVGHSERRSDHRETDKLVRAKAEAALRSGLKAIICIGETEDDRTGGKALEVVKRQLASSLPDGATADNTVIAYEPVWAIGSGRTPTTDEVEEVHALIRDQLAKHLGDEIASGVRILYGGSMKPENAKELLALKDVDGGLIGGASLNAKDFWAIGQSWG